MNERVGMKPAIATMLIIALFAAAPSHADDWPMLGRDNTRNGVSTEKNPPLFWQIEGVATKFENRRAIEWTTESKNVRWKAELGVNTFGTPVVADGLVWIGTTYKDPDVKRAGLLKCFRERDGELLYEYESTMHEDAVDSWTGAPWIGISSTPLVEGDRLWLTSLGAELVCLDIAPLKRGGGEPIVVWKRDMRKEWGVYPWACIMGPGFMGNVAVHEHLLYAITGNGCSYDGPPPAPEAPSLVCLDKRTGELIWQDASPGVNILNAQWGSPLVAEIGGRAQVIVPQGDGWMRAVDALTGELLWKFDINPKESKWTTHSRGARNHFLAAPVFHDGRVYIASGHTPEHGEGPGRLVCIDPSKNGDISSELAVDADGNPLPQRRIQAVDPAQGERAIANPNSGLVWEYRTFDRDGNGTIDFEEEFHRSLSNVAIKDGLLIAVDFSGLVHCLDAKTGKVHWAYDTLAAVWASPLIVDDKVYVADEDGEVAIFRLTAQSHEPLREINLNTSINSSPVFANGTLYVADRNTLFAIADEESVPEAAAGGHWPQWRGPNRDNVSTETGLLKEWPEEGPPLVWRVDGIGEGIACVSIAEDRIYATGYYEQGEFLTALDQHTGQRVWAAHIGPRVEENRLMRWISQRSPTVDGERLYAITAAGRLVCLQTQDGRELWSKSYPDDFGALHPKWGFCDYPLVDGEKLICTPGGAQASVVALDKRTGEEIWRVAIPDGGLAAYAAVVVAEAGGVRQYIAFLQRALVAVRASDGELLWSYDKIANGVANSHTPAVRGDRLLVTNGYGTGVALLKLIANGEKVEAQEQYFERIGLDAFQDNSVLVGDHIYASSAVGHLCLDWTSGQKAWSVRTTSRGKAAVTCADQRLYLHQSDGRVTLADVSPAGHQERGHFMLPDHAPSLGATSPVIAGRRLYLRGDHRLFCYDIREDALRQPSAAPPSIVLDAPTAETFNANRGRTLRSVFVPTPLDIVEKMLELAEVNPADVVYDLGSGDGRIVITAAQKHGCRAVGYEIDRELVETSRERARQAGVERLITFEQQDLFTADLRDADVIVVYLLPQQLEKLLPQFEKLKPGSRIVSHQFEIPGVEPDRTITTGSGTDGDLHRILLWTTPLKAAPPRSE